MPIPTRLDNGFVVVHIDGMRTALLFVPIAALGLAVFACPASHPSEGEGEGNDGGVKVEDGGFSGEGEGQAGEGEGAAGEGEGEGAPVDAGFQGTEYSGTAEDGVKCGSGAAETLCTTGSDCCVSTDQQFNITATCGTAGQACPAGGGFFNASVACDGKEDCQASEECCFNSQTFSTTCVAAGTCESAGSNNATVCVNTGDCVAGTETCCGFSGSGSGAGFALPVDMGICRPSSSNCSG